MVFRKVNQCLIDLFPGDTGARGNQSFVDEDKIGKKTCIGTEDSLQNGVDDRVLLQITVQFIAGNGKHEARCAVVLLDIFDIARKVEQFQGVMCLTNREMEGSAEILDNKVVGSILPKADSYLEEVSQGFIDTINKILLRELVGVTLLQPQVIATGTNGDSVCLFPITSGTSGLLIILFQRAGHIQMDDKTDVGLVDAHAEGVRGDDNPALSALPTILA